LGNVATSSSGRNRIDCAKRTASSSVPCQLHVRVLGSVLRSRLSPTSTMAALPPPLLGPPPPPLLGPPPPPLAAVQAVAAAAAPLQPSPGPSPAAAAAAAAPPPPPPPGGYHLLHNRYVRVKFAADKNAVVAPSET
jgi:hypothetical protein